MPLASGARLGVYEVLEPIGAGGMGEVYRARDVTLQRDVALKILPEAFALDADRLARFRREAQVLASLNHPNIASIYGFESAGPVQVLVLEFVEGPTLADRIAGDRIPIDEALTIAKQIAIALEAAHQQGIVHRDLKPANIKVRSDGTVKVLDFGLARAMTDGTGTVDGSQPPTITSPALTRMGVILGTAAYMSPEQARGKVADKRSDIWAFGCVLYEMLTGRRTFEGEEISDTLASVLKSSPDLGAFPAETPSGVRRVIRRCLEKDPASRYHDVADARLDLADATSLNPSPPAVGSVRSALVERAAWALVALILGALLVYALQDKPTPLKIVQFEVAPPENTTFGSTLGMGGNLVSVTGSLSPDGTQLVFAATDAGGKTLLWVRSLDALTARALPGTDEGMLPFWSPDSRHVGFYASRRLKKVDVTGGAVQTLCEAADTPKGATWGANGIILFSAGTTPALFRVSSEGGTPTRLEISDAEHKSVQHSWPQFLPDGRHFLYWGRTADDFRGVFLASLEPGDVARPMVTSDSQGAYVSPGWLLFVREGTLLRQPVDAERLTMASSEATPLVEGISSLNEIGLAAFSASWNGVVSYRSGLAATTQFAWFDRNGRNLGTVGPPGSYRAIALSPDERRVAYGDVAKGDVWTLDLVRQTSTRVTHVAGSIEASPVWSLDGTRLFYRSTQEGSGIYEKNASGALAERLLLRGRVNGPSQVSPDGTLLLYFAAPSGEMAQDIFVVPLNGEPTPRAVIQTPFADVEPQFSPDGRWLAYLSNATGRHEVYVEPFPPTGKDRVQISNTSARQPMWSRDGKELFFVNNQRKLYAVDVSTASGFQFGTPRFLFDLPADVFNARSSYAPSRDGKRFLVNTLLENAAPPINVLLNWTAGVSR